MTYNEVDRMIAKQSSGKVSEAYAYDAAGNLTKQTDSNGTVNEYKYNDNNKPFSMVKSGEGKSYEETYTYDGNGNITKVMQGTKVTNFIYDYLNNLTYKHTRGIGEIYEYDGNQNLTTVYATEGIKRYLLDQYDYDPNGNITDNTGFQLSDELDSVNITASYTGHIYDYGTGYWNAGAREYDPATKRFISEDPENGSMENPISTMKL